MAGQILLQLPNIQLPAVKYGSRQTRVYLGQLLEEVQEVLPAPRAA